MLMIDMENLLYEKVKSVISEWDEEGIYAISFFVESNESNTYKAFRNVTDFAVSFNTESDCEGAGPYDEERWNYAFWRQDETLIIDTYNGSPETVKLFEWYAENGLSNIGYEDADCYDEQFRYTGKGPVGHYELLNLASGVACRLQSEQFIHNHFGKTVPIIVHGLEYAWYDLEATKTANPHGEADAFLKAMKIPD